MTTITTTKSNNSGSGRTKDSDSQFAAQERIGGAGFLRWSTVGVLAYGGWLVANILLFCLFIVLLPFELLKKRSGSAVLRVVGTWFLRVFFLNYFSLIRVYRTAELPLKEQLQKKGPRLFVANHSSWLDALLLTGLIPDVRIPVNAAYTRVPIAGRAMRWLGCVPLDRNSRESITRGVSTVRRALKNGGRIAVFPEGTRSSNGELGPFSELFFRIAIEENIPITPVLIHLTVPFLGPGKENLLTAKCGALTIRLLDDVLPERGERGAFLARKMKKLMQAELSTLDDPKRGFTRGQKNVKSDL